MLNNRAWIEEHFTDPPGYLQQEAVDWLRSRPDCVKQVMKLFPPSCEVRVVKKRKWCDCKIQIGSIGLVRSYHEVFEVDHLNRVTLESKTLVGTVVGVSFGPDEVAHKFYPGEIECTGRFWNDLTCKKMKKLLSA